MELTVGSVVTDREMENTQARVVNLPPVSISDWHVHGRGSVASDNPEYPEDERVAIVVHENDFPERYGDYTSGLAIPVKQLNREGVAHYAFPRSRLVVVESPEPLEIPVDKIDPSPYHARNFDLRENQDFISEIESRGHPDPHPVVRPIGGRWEIINGHRRLWACHVAGIERIPCYTVPLGKREAAKAWGYRHLNGYSKQERKVALDRLESRLGPGAETLADEITP